jgi:hypothetical protein
MLTLSLMGGTVMNKRKFLAPLAVSVAALLGGVTIPVQASTVLSVTNLKSAPTVSNHLVLKRSTGSEIRLADHESHASHESHSSHVSGS